MKAIYLPSTSRQVTMKGIKQMDLPWVILGIFQIQKQDYEYGLPLW